MGYLKYGTKVLIFVIKVDWWGEAPNGRDIPQRSRMCTVLALDRSPNARRAVDRACATSAGSRSPNAQKGQDKIAAER